MDVGESPINESLDMCSALRFPGTMALCENPVALIEKDGKMVPVMRAIDGGNKGVGFNVPLCSMHAARWDEDPSSIEVAIPPSPVKR
jgi:hypothetical protein